MSSNILSNGTTDTIDLLLGMQGDQRWTDDLPVCQQTSVGTSPQTIYFEGHSIRRESEDRYFLFSLEDGCSLYGVFDGHDGHKLSNFVAQRIPAELLFDQLSGKKTDKEIKEVLQQAFTAVEKGYIESVMDYLSEKAALQFEIQENSDYGPLPDIQRKLQDVEAKLAGGTTATVVLLHNNKVFEVNVGNTRALLCKKVDNRLQVTQLSVDHTIDNESELARLQEIGIDIEQVKRLHKLGNSENTRCIGDHSVKEGHKDIEILRNATAEPVTAIPDLCESYEIDNSTAFLIIMTQGLYKAVQDIEPTERANVTIADLVAKEFYRRTPLKKLAQAVVDRVVYHHQEAAKKRRNIQRREDITLLVRHFNYPVGDSTSSTPSSPYLSLNPFPQHIGTPSPGSPSRVSLQFNLSSPRSTPSPSTNPYFSGVSVVDGSATGGNINQPPHTPNLNESDSNRSSTKTQTLTNSPNSQNSLTNTNTNTNTNSTQSSGESKLINSHHHSTSKLPLDNDGKVEAHVDFSAFYSHLQELTESQRDQLFNELRPKPDYDTIEEESE